jgi:hypothetical protein
MPRKNASDAGLSTQEEMHRSLREILDEIGVEIYDLFHSRENWRVPLVFCAMLNL